LIEHGSVWAAKIHKLLLEIYRQSQKGRQLLTDKATWHAKYMDICDAAAEEEPIPITPRKPEVSPKTPEVETCSTAWSCTKTEQSFLPSI
jgi:hypothetical protein